MNSFLYDYLSYEIFLQYKKIFSARKNILALWKRDKSLVLSFLVSMSSLVATFLLTILKIKLVYAILGAGFFLVFMYIFYKKVSSIHRFSYSQDTEMIVKVKKILIENGINIESQETIFDLLEENCKIEEDSKEKFKNVFLVVSKLFNLFLVAPVAFLLTVAFNLEIQSSDINSVDFIERFTSLIPVIGIVGLFLVFSLSYMFVSFMNDDFLNFVFPSNNKAVIFNKYVRTLTYDSIFTNQKKITDTKKHQSGSNT